MAYSPPRSIFYLIFLGVLLGTIAIVVRSGMLARKNPGRPINSAMRAALAETTPQFSTDDAMLIAKTYGTAKKFPSGLQWVEHTPGTGDGYPRIGGEVIAHYAGRLIDGTPFDSSYQRGVPLTFRVGMGVVIAGWDEAFLTMKKGEKRTLIIPYWLGYGLKGQPPKIPPKATLIFEVELIDFR
jgi:FKBP-type peptidyl-prolyl cis-trans isomerase